MQKTEAKSKRFKEINIYLPVVCWCYHLFMNTCGLEIDFFKYAPAIYMFAF